MQKCGVVGLRNLLSALSPRQAPTAEPAHTLAYKIQQNPMTRLLLRALNAATPLMGAKAHGAKL